MKRCTMCGDPKPLEDFYLRKSKYVRKDGTIAYYRMSECRQCNAYRGVQYQKNNKRTVNAKNKKWRDRNKEKCNRLVHEWWLKNKERRSKKIREWKKANQYRLTEAQRNREISKRQATPKWADRDKMLAFYERAARLSAETGIPHHVDHIVPIISELVCGLHVENNLQILAASENLKKSNKLIAA